MLPRRAEVLFAAVVLVLAVFALLFGGLLIVDPPIPLERDLLAMNPRVFPSLILVGTLIVTLIFLLGLAREGAFKPQATPPGLSDGASTAMWRQGIFLVITITCALLLTTLGFVGTMLLLMVSTSLLVGNRSPVQILAVSTLIPVGFYIVVTHVLRTALPEVDFVQRLLAPVIRLVPAF